MRMIDDRHRCAVLETLMAWAASLGRDSALRQCPSLFAFLLLGTASSGKVWKLEDMAKVNLVTR